MPVEAANTVAASGQGVPYISQWQLLLKDLRESVKLWRLWMHLGWEDVAKQYRRSFLGPVWISLNTAFFTITFGLIGAQLFKMPVQEYLPYFCVGQILFTYLTSQLVEGCQTFSAADAFLKQTPYPKFAFALRVVWRNLIMLLHNVPIILGVLVWSGQLGSIRPLGFGLALLAVVVSASLVVALLGAISARFRDVPMIISSLMQISFFVTPVMWRTSQLTERAQLVVFFNPLAAYLDILRAPLLGVDTAHSSWATVGIAMVVLLLLFGTVFQAARRRIVYWI
jgi:lipopolysaccharide transport system permease protein